MLVPRFGLFVSSSPFQGDDRDQGADTQGFRDKKLAANQLRRAERVAIPA